jgi:hypothetical protein
MAKRLVIGELNHGHALIEGQSYIKNIGFGEISFRVVIKNFSCEIS